MWMTRDSIFSLKAGDRRFKFGVHVADDIGNAGLRVSRLRNEVISWCEANCINRYEVGEYELIQFACEEDAILFYMTFRK